MEAQAKDAGRSAGQRQSENKMRNSAKQFGARQRRDDDLVRALDHRLRRRIMLLLHASETPLDTSEIAVSLDEKLGRASHHIEVLRRRGLIVLVGLAGNGEGIYESRVKDRATVAIFLEQADRTNSAASDE
jgi:DNA-binding transcriptional ArsR family regulator